MIAWILAGGAWVAAGAWTLWFVGQEVTYFETRSARFLYYLLFWPVDLVIAYVEGIERQPKEKNRGRNRQAEADHRDTDSATDPNDPAGSRARASASAGAHPGMTMDDLTRRVNEAIQQGLVWHTSPTTAPQITFNYSAPTINPPEPKPEPERVKSTMPIMATRWAIFVLTSEGPRFSSVTSNGGVFENEADATCQAGFNRYSLSPAYASRPTKHDAPDFDCTCGFHAVPADKLPKHAAYGGVQLLVELSGTVIEHEEGYRASHQRVLQATIPRCPGCGDTATRAWICPENEDFTAHPPLWDCGQHEITSGEDTLMAVSVEQLAKSLGVPFVAETT